MKKSTAAEMVLVLVMGSAIQRGPVHTYIGVEEWNPIWWPPGSKATDSGPLLRITPLAGAFHSNVLYPLGLIYFNFPSTGQVPET